MLNISNLYIQTRFLPIFIIITIIIATMAQLIHSVVQIRVNVLSEVMISVYGSTYKVTIILCIQIIQFYIGMFIKCILNIALVICNN